MNPHSNAQTKAQVDAHVLAVRPLPRHYLCHRAQPKCLEKEDKREKQRIFKIKQIPGKGQILPVNDNIAVQKGKESSDSMEHNQCIQKCD